VLRADPDNLAALRAAGHAYLQRQDCEHASEGGAARDSKILGCIITMRCG
jgi:hypothetical protein